MFATVRFSTEAAPSARRSAHPTRVAWLCCEPPAALAGPYRGHGFRAVQLTLSPRRPPSESDGDDLLLAQLRRRTRGRDRSHPGSLLLLVTCRLAARDASAFLAHFDRASAYMAEQPGFVRLCLFERSGGGAPYHFLNLIEWRALAAYREAFARPDFGRLRSGGFEQITEVSVARVATFLSAPQRSGAGAAQSLQPDGR